MKKARPVAPVLPSSRACTVVDPIGLDGARITSGVWADWQRDNRQVTTPHAFRWLERDGTIDNLRRLDPAVKEPGERRGLWFTDSDLYKAVEGVAWDLGRDESLELGELTEHLASIIAKAQQPDGYINSFVQAGLEVRWDNLVKSHELYCIGHLIQAGIADRRATGRTALFDVAVKAADIVVADFGHGKRTELDGHEEIEMALVELYRETDDVAYLELAGQFVDLRGHRTLGPTRYGDSEYYQDATPVRQETTVVGHAVRAVYLLAGVVDLYLETGDQSLLHAAITQWESMTSQKTYLNGAVGSRFEGEAFGASYELPPDLAYGETCATIGNIMLSWRLLLATGESRFADAIERALYNLFAASTSLSRNGFYYNNPAQRRRPLPAAPMDQRPARADAPGTRPEWFECACCPPNIMRQIASLSAYLATHTSDAIQLHQYMPSDVRLPLRDGEVRLVVDTAYPLEGTVEVTVLGTPGTEWDLSLRKPDWAASFAIEVNGTELHPTIGGDGYVHIRRSWTERDTVRLFLPVVPRFTIVHPAVDALRGTVAIERGPVVYAFESHDQTSSVDLNHVEIDVNRPLIERGSEFLGRATVLIEASGWSRDDSAWDGMGWANLECEPENAGKSITLTAIPYAYWANRGPSVMRIHTPRRTASEKGEDAQGTTSP